MTAEDRVNYDEMPAGRELDALVAEKVMGEPKPSGRPISTGAIAGGPVFFEPWSERNGWTAEWVPGTEPVGPDFGCWEFVPRPFSTDIAASLGLIPRIPRDVRLNWMSPVIHTGGIRWGVEVYDGPRVIIIEWADELPLAICRAALKAVAA